VTSSARPLVEEHPKGSGRWRVRARVDGKLKTLGSKLTEAEANDAADAYVVVRNESEIRAGMTLTQFGIGFLERREVMGIRGIRTDRNYWKNHVDGDPLGKVAVSAIRRRDVVEWLDRRKAEHRTRIKILNLLRTALRDAVERELLEQNPAREVRVHRAGGARSTDDLEGILTPTEQKALISAVDPLWRPLVVFGLVTGMRQAEQWWLMWEDPLGASVFADKVVVRRSTGGEPPKSGKIREVYLMPAAAAALTATKRRKSPFVFAGPRGARRQEGKAPGDWRNWLAAAGITRRVRWHDLRHTCATSLLAGWWGRKWSLDEVCSYLGHSSVKVTERYARKLAESQRLAVAATPTFVIPGNENRELTMRNDSTDRAFVKRRSPVQVRESAPVEDLAVNLLNPATGGGEGKLGPWDQSGISALDDFEVALREHLGAQPPREAAVTAITRTREEAS
jgi:integrase